MAALAYPSEVAHASGTVLCNRYLLLLGGMDSANQMNSTGRLFDTRSLSLAAPGDDGLTTDAAKQQAVYIDSVYDSAKRATKSVAGGWLPIPSTDSQGNRLNGLHFYPSTSGVVLNCSQISGSGGDPHATTLCFVDANSWSTRMHIDKSFGTRSTNLALTDRGSFGCTPLHFGQYIALVGGIADGEFSAEVVFISTVGGAVSKEIPTRAGSKYSMIRVPPLPEARAFPAVCEFDTELLESELIVAGGATESDGRQRTCLALPLKAGDAKWIPFPSLINPRSSGTLCVLDSQLYIVGGVVSSESGDDTSGACERYDAVNKRWIEIAAMPYRRSHAVVYVLN